MNTNDQQAQFAFVVQQAFVISAQVYQRRFPDLDFGRLIFVDTSAPEWTPGIITFTSTTVGKAQWYSGAAKDVPRADAALEKSQANVSLAAIGYGWDVEEVGQAQLLGIGLNPLKAEAARRAYAEFMWKLALTGDPGDNRSKTGLFGISNSPNAIAALAPADGTGGVTTWFDAAGNQTKTAAQIIRDFNSALTGVFLGTATAELADTVLLPFDILQYLASTVMPNTTETLLAFIERTNLYTQQTGQALTIRGVVGLETAGGTTAAPLRRMVAYANRQDVAVLHLPMPHRFLPVYQDGPTSFEVPGIFRTGGVSVLRPQAFRYLDGI